jgi:hypothetical protein
MDTKTLCANGWIAMVILSIITFGAYYFLVFPKLVDQNQKMFYRQYKIIADKNALFQMEANVPKSLSDFQEGTATLNITCATGKEKCTGLFDLVSFLVNEGGEEVGNSRVTLKRLDLKDQPTVVRNLYIEYNLKAYEIMSVPISVQILGHNEEEKVAFSVYENPPNGLAVKWGDVTCKADDNIRICASIDPRKALRQGAVENILLPPWSNTIIPFIVFAMVWLAEQVMPKQKEKEWGDQPNVWMLCLIALGAYFLFLFYAVLYFYLLMDAPFIALFFAVLLVLSIIAFPKLFSSLFGN